ncbi:hypothetical protein B9Z19DRAFT_1118940 [Tuber borchii]|uniref:BTB domain-containing protein n=1 Tax=Tuber borchii TaxID=42251 RepID=A0A2T7A768_TUBBO|nr:hypothetical protein B9Z19DRAFT_1118940 [Tuber borchii]
MDSSEREIDPYAEFLAIRAIPTSSSASTSTTTSIFSSASASTSTSVSTSASISTAPLKLALNSKAKAIDPNGDVLITFPSTTTKLLVSAKILSVTSPLFEKIFLLHQHNTPELVEIEINGHSPEALETAFCVLHSLHQCVSTNLSPDTLYGIALAEYRYCFMSALGPWKEVWLKNGTGGGGKGMFVRYVFGDREGFKEECRRVVLKSLGDIGDEGEREIGWDANVVPKRVYELISEERISTIRSLLLVAEHFRSIYYNHNIKCRVFIPPPVLKANNPHCLSSCDLGILGSLHKHHHIIGILPVPQSPYKGISVENIAQAMKALPNVVDGSDGHGECSIVGSVVRLVDEVLARLDRWDIGDSIFPTPGLGLMDACAVKEMSWENLSGLKPMSLRYTTRKEAMEEDPA